VPRNTKGLEAGSQEREVAVSGRDMQARRERSLALSSATTGLEGGEGQWQLEGGEGQWQWSARCGGWEEPD
jgi:hypothetical protein